MFDVRVLGRRQVAAAVRPLVRAFWSFPETVHLLPDERKRRHVLPRYLASDALDAARFGTLLGVSDGDRIIGAAAWLPPEAYPISVGRQLRQLAGLAPVLPWAIGAAREAQRGQKSNREHHQGFPPHFFLRAVGVDPAEQGKGIGTKLVRPIVEQADQQGVGAFLFTATVENVGRYENLGFAVTAEYHPTPRWPCVWAMWHAPTKPPGTVARHPRHLAH